MNIKFIKKKLISYTNTVSHKQKTNKKNKKIL